jgi:hypothetical protein
MFLHVQAGVLFLNGRPRAPLASLLTLTFSSLLAILPYGTASLFQRYSCSLLLVVYRSLPAGLLHDYQVRCHVPFVSFRSFAFRQATTLNTRTNTQSMQWANMAQILRSIVAILYTIANRTP